MSERELAQTLGVVEPVDAHHQRAVAEAAAQPDRLRPVGRRQRLRPHLVHMHADRIDAGVDHAAEGEQPILPDRPAVAMPKDIVAERSVVGLGLEADQIELA